MHVTIRLFPRLHTLFGYNFLMNGLISNNFWIIDGYW